MPPPSTSLADSVLFWCVCVGVLAASATWFATLLWWRRSARELEREREKLAREQRAEHARLVREEHEKHLAAVRQTHDRALDELQAKLRALEQAPRVGPLELEALIIRRWLRNAGEHANPSPQKAVTSAAAIGLAFLGPDHLRARVEPLTVAARKIEQAQALGHDVGLELTHPETQASQQWIQVLAELDALLAPDAAPALLEEWLRGNLKRGGDYWNERALRLAAGEVLTQGHMAAIEIARKRANGSAVLGAPTEPPDEATGKTPPAG